MDESLEVDDVKELSALQENIQKKGKNAYYYAHGPKIDGPKWDGKEEPRLMDSLPISGSSSERFVTFSAFDSFAWVDEKKKVKIYVDFDKADELSDDAISICKISSDAVEFSVQTGKKQFKLVLDSLSGSIGSINFKKKSDKFIITLEKETETVWFELRKTKK
jgi:hypothetical protein